MSRAVPRQECDALLADPPDHVRVRRRTERRFQSDFLRIDDAVHAVEAAAAHYPKDAEVFRCSGHDPVSATHEADRGSGFDDEYLDYHDADASPFDPLVYTPGDPREFGMTVSVVL